MRDPQPRHRTVRTLTTLLLLGLLTMSLIPASSGTHPADARTITGAWETPFEGEVPAVNMALLPDGRVLYYSGVEANDTHHDPTRATYFTDESVGGVSRILELTASGPVIHTPGHADGAGDDLFCSGIAFLPDGRLIAVGGTDWDTLPEATTPVQGIADTRIFDPSTDTWVRTDDLDVARWYPSVINLADGSPATFSGITNLTMPHTMVLPVERFDLVTNTWSTIEDGDRLLPMYPRVSIVPGGPLKGDVFYNTVGTLWGPFGAHPAEATWSIQQSLDLDTATWTDHGPSLLGARQHASNVMLPLSAEDDYAPEFITFGGTLQRSIVASPLTERIDLASGTPESRLAASMEHGRWHHNGVLLPTGDVLAIGGAGYDNVVVHGQPNVPVLAAELYDPDADTWTTLAEATVPRMYHSTAILLPDGSVLAGGHVPLANPFTPARDEIGDTGVSLQPQVKESRLEVFNPPYMFSDHRPEIHAINPITGYPSAGVIVERPAVAYDQDVNIVYGSDFAVESVMLVRPGATTHAFDSTQRAIELPITTMTEGSVQVTMPPDGDVAPPGHYMVFVNAATPDGTVPSEAAWVILG